MSYLRSLTAASGEVRYSRTSRQTPVWVTGQALAALSRKTLPLARVPRARRARRRAAAAAAAAAAPAAAATPTVAEPQSLPPVRRRVRRAAGRARRRRPGPGRGAPVRGADVTLARPVSYTVAPPMRIGVPKETAAGERRVALVPDVVRRLAAAGHEVVIEPGAGAGAGFAGRGVRGGGGRARRPLGRRR